MSGWWRDLSARERMLILVAGGLAAVLLVSLAVVQPLADLRADADRRAKAARDGYELTAAAAAIAGGGDQSAGDNQTPLRQAVIATAAAAGIELVRIGSESDGQVEIQLAPVSGEILFSWLSQMQSQFGATVAIADITRGEAGLVNPQMLVLERR